MQQITCTVDSVDLVYQQNIWIVVIARDSPAMVHYLTKRSFRVEQIESQSDCSCSLFPLVNQPATLLTRDLFGDTDAFPDELLEASASFPLWPEVRIFSMALPSTYQYQIKRKISFSCDLSLFYDVLYILNAQMNIHTLTRKKKMDHCDIIMAYFFADEYI